MKLLHTSDWHLGQFFMGKSRQSEHQAFINWLVNQAIKLDVDAILIAGDVFDTGAPPSYARELYNQLIVELQKTHTQVIILAGNHDSVSVLEESKQLLSHMNTQVIASTPKQLSDAVISIKNKQEQTQALVCAIPYLRAQDLLISQAGQSAKQKEMAMQAAIKQHYQDVYDEALIKQAEIKKHTGNTVPIIATGHLTAIGASSSESVRDIYVGNLKALAASAFPDVDYIALGHIHRPQKVAGNDFIRYSGSPIALSFDEIDQKKQILLLEFSESGNKTLSEIEVPTFQAMASLKGNLEFLAKEIPSICEAFLQTNSQQRLWLEVVITNDDYLKDLQQRLDKICADLPIDILRIKRERATQNQSIKLKHAETLDELSTTEVFLRRLKSESLDPEQEKQLLQLYKQVLTKVELEHS